MMSNYLIQRYNIIFYFYIYIYQINNKKIMYIYISYILNDYEN